MNPASLVALITSETVAAPGSIDRNRWRSLSARKSGAGSLGGTMESRSNQAIVRAENEPGNAKVG